MTSLLLLPQASTFAVPSDLLFWAVNAITIFFSVLVAALIVGFIAI